MYTSNSCDIPTSMCGCVEPARETTMHDVLEMTKTMVMDIRESSTRIRNSLFGGVGDSSDKTRKENTCAQDLMVDIASDLSDIANILNYICNRL